MTHPSPTIPSFDELHSNARFQLDYHFTPMEWKLLCLLATKSVWRNQSDIHAILWPGTDTEIHYASFSSLKSRLNSKLSKIKRPINLSINFPIAFKVFSRSRHSIYIIQSFRNWIYYIHDTTKAHAPRLAKNLVLQHHYVIYSNATGKYLSSKRVKSVKLFLTRAKAQEYINKYRSRHVAYSVVEVTITPTLAPSNESYT